MTTFVIVFYDGSRLAVDNPPPDLVKLCVLRFERTNRYAAIRSGLARLSYHRDGDGVWRRSNSRRGNFAGNNH